MTLFTRALASDASAEAPGGTAREEPLFLRLCRVFVEATVATGGAFTMAPNELHRMTLCVTDDLAARLENLQEVIGQGPLADAAASDQVVTARLGTGDGSGRWPVLSSTVADELGTVTVYCFPIRVAEQSVGVASVYRRLGDGIWIPPVKEASLLADVIGSAIAASGLDGDAGLVWDVRERISQATGMVIAQLGIGPEDALALLRAAAFSAGRDLGELELLTATSHRARDLELFQLQVEEGPCCDCIATGALVSERGAERLRSRWGRVGEAIVDAGFDAVHASRSRGTASPSAG